MSLTKTFLSEAVADRRRKQVLIRIFKIMYKTIDKELYNNLRDYLQRNSSSLNRSYYLKVMAKIKYTIQGRSFAYFFGRLSEEEQMEVLWAFAFSLYRVVEQTDPTDNGKYMNWLVTAWISPFLWDKFGKMDMKKLEKLALSIAFEGRIYEVLSEDTSKYRKLLKKFEKAKELGTLSEDEADINNYEEIEDLFDRVSELETDPEALLTRQESVEKDSKIIYEDQEFKFIVPESHEASCAWGTGTNWCTAVDENPQTYEHYMKEGDLIILIGKNNDRKFQAHWESGADLWFMNERDKFALEEFEQLVGSEDFTKYLRLIIFWSIRNNPNKTIALSELDVFIDEIRDKNLSEYYTEVDFLTNEIVEAMTTDLINIIKSHPDDYTALAKDIMEILKADLPYKISDSSLRDKWRLIMAEYTHASRIFNDVFFVYKNEAKETDKAIEKYIQETFK